MRRPEPNALVASSPTSLASHWSQFSPQIVTGKLSWRRRGSNTVALLASVGRLSSNLSGTMPLVLMTGGRWWVESDTWDRLGSVTEESESDPKRKSRFVYELLTGEADGDGGFPG